MTCPSTVLGALQVRWKQKLACIPLTLFWIWIPPLAWMLIVVISPWCMHLLVLGAYLSLSLSLSPFWCLLLFVNSTNWRVRKYKCLLILDITCFLYCGVLKFELEDQRPGWRYLLSGDKVTATLHNCSLSYELWSRGEELGIGPTEYTELLSSPWRKGTRRQDVCEVWNYILVIDYLPLQGALPSHCGSSWPVVTDTLRDHVDES